MAAIRSVDSAPEMRVRKAVHAAGFRYRLHEKRLPGSPDLVFARFRLAVFVHGCFWHGHECGIGHIPASNTEYWTAKINRNMTRDSRNIRELGENGWNIRVIYECNLETGTKGLVTELASLRGLASN